MDAERRLVFDTYLDGSPNATILGLGGHKEIKKIFFRYRIFSVFVKTIFMQQTAP